jgi:acyl-CoA thioesterase-1
MRSAFSSLLPVPYGALRALRNLTFACALASPALAAPATIVALGDSLTAGYGLPAEDGLVPQLQAWLRARGHDVTIVNAGVSGDTTAGGLARLDWSLAPETDALIVTLGGNDMLRGLAPSEARANLDQILKRATAKGLPVLLVGLAAPRNYGPDYRAEFDAIYPDLAKTYGTLLDRNLFAPLVANGADPASVAPYFQSDGIHPNKQGVAVIVEALGPQVEELMTRIVE